MTGFRSRKYFSLECYDICILLYICEYAHYRGLSNVVSDGHVHIKNNNGQLL